MKSKIYPLIAIFSTLIIMIFGLIYVSSFYCLYYVGIIYLLLFIFGMWKECLKILIPTIIFIAIFDIIIYLSTHDYSMMDRMTLRFLVIFVSIIPSSSIYIVDFTTNLNQIHTPRFISLGLMVTFSFIPNLRIEMKRIKEAMKSRGVNLIINPKVFYRACLIPLIMRITNISDTLSLSIETRCFKAKGCYSIYNLIKIRIKDMLFILLVISLSVLLVWSVNYL